MFKKKLNKKPFVVTEIKLFVRANFFFFFFVLNLTYGFYQKIICLKLKKKHKKSKEKYDILFKNIQHKVGKYEILKKKKIFF